MPAAPRVQLPIKTGGVPGGAPVRSPANPGRVNPRSPASPADPILRLAREQKRTLSDREMQAARQIDNDWQRLVAVPLGVELSRFADRYQQALDALADDGSGDDEEEDFGPVSAGGPTSPANPGRFGPRSPVSPANPGARMGGGDTVPSTWLLDAHGGDAHGLLRSARGQITKFAQATQKTVAHAAADASAQGMTDGQQLLAIALQPLVGASGGELDPEDFLQAGVAAARKDARFALLSQLMNSGGPLAQLLGSMPQESADQAYRTLLYGLGHGENPQALVTDLQQILNSSRSRALTISRTEMMNAYRGAQLDNYRANSDVVQGWIWLADMASACPMCVDLNGEIHPLDDDMVSHPRCFPAGTVVSGPRAIAGTERYYAGRLVEVVTAGGKRLSVTPNHPILTTQGWVAAGELVEGDDVVCTRGSEGPLGGIRPDDYQIPAFIEDVAHAPGGALSVTARSVPTATEDFHGDGGDGEVRIVRPNRELRRGLQAALSQPVRELPLCRRHEALRALAGTRTLAQFLESLPPSARSIVGGAGSGEPFLNGRATRPQAVGLTAIADGDASNTQPGANDAANNAVRLGERKFGLTTDIAPHDLLIGNATVGAVGSSGVLSAETVALSERAQEAALLERLGQTLLAGVEASSRDLRALTSDICLDRVLEVSVRDFSGHVYNLETTHGWYVANSIIAHNCRCSPAPYTKSWDDILSPVGLSADELGLEDTSLQVESGEDWFARQDEATQRSILGPAAFNAYQGGALQLSDLVGRNPDGSYYQKSMKEAGLDANAWLGKGPNAGVPVRVEIPGGGYTYVTPGPLSEDVPQFNTADRTAGWQSIDEEMSNLRAFSPDAAGGAGGGSSSYELTEDDRAFAQSIRDQIPEGGVTSADDAMALGDQVRARVENNLSELKGYAQEAQGIRERAPNLTDEERAWAMGDKAAIEAHGGYHVFGKNSAEWAYQDQYQAQMRAYLGETREVGGVEVKLNSAATDFDRFVAERVASAAEQLPSDWLRASNELGDINAIKSTERLSGGWHLGNRDGSSTLAVRYTKGSGISQLDSMTLHELVHRMQMSIPALSKLEDAFYEARTAGEALVPLTNGIKAKTKLDEWLDEYLGREPIVVGRPPYQLPEGTYRYAINDYELLTMGAEMLFAPGVDMSTFALWRDPQYVSFVLGVFLGVQA